MHSILKTLPAKLVGSVLPFGITARYKHTKACMLIPIKMPCLFTPESVDLIYHQRFATHKDADKDVLDFWFVLEPSPRQVSLKERALSEVAGVIRDMLQKRLIDISSHTHYIHDGRTLWYMRVYISSDFTCREHPEFMYGSGDATYACPCCVETQRCGHPHF